MANENKNPGFKAPLPPAELAKTPAEHTGPHGEPLPPNENKNSGTYGNVDDSKVAPVAPPLPEVTPRVAAAIEENGDEALKRAKEAAEANAARELAAQVANQGGTGFKVAPGMSITTRRGLVDSGAVVSDVDFVGGKADFDDLVARGAIVKS